MSEYADIKIRNLSLYSFRNYLQEDTLQSLKQNLLLSLIMMRKAIKVNAPWRTR